MNFRINLSVGLMLVILIVILETVPCSSKKVRNGKSSKRKDNVGKPLVLTPYLNSHGQPELARSLSEVTHPQLSGIKSYAGYFYANSSQHNLFFWYFPAKENPETAPVVLFLDGVPGKDSFFSLFEQNGPFSVAPNGSLVPRLQSWNNKHHMIYMDSVIGLGYSYSDNKRDIVRQKPGMEMGYEVYDSVVQFFHLFPWLRKNHFFVSGHYYTSVIAISLYEYLRREEDLSYPLKNHIHLGGVIIANGFVNKSKQFIFGDYLYTNGLIDANGRKQFLKLEKKIQKSLKSHQYDSVYDTFEKLIIGNASLFNSLTGYAEPFNIIDDGSTPIYSSRYIEWIQREDVRHALHTGKKKYHKMDKIARENLNRLVTDEQDNIFNNLLTHYPVLMYSGNLDVLCSPLLTNNTWIGKLSWAHAADYREAKKEQWHDADGELAGYMRRGGNLIKAVIINAGHLSSIEKPQQTLELVEKFTSGKLRGHKKEHVNYLEPRQPLNVK